MTIRKVGSFATASLFVFCSIAACAKKEAPPPPADNAPSGKGVGGRAAAALPIPTVATAEVLTQNDAGAFVTKSARVNGTQSLEEALKVAKEEFPLDAQSRSAAIVDWSEERLRWADVDMKKNQTSTLLALKDPEGAYGKRACLTGKLTTITAVRDADASALLHFKAVLEGPGERWNLSAVGDTAELVKGSTAKFCGLAVHVRTQRADGGTLDTLDVVGMFDLPENRKR
ncbi:MAG: hypothetical protein U0174_02695 [Polyangiaceae bacterium]